MKINLHDLIESTAGAIFWLNDHFGLNLHGDLMVGHFENVLGAGFIIRP